MQLTSPIRLAESRYINLPTNNSNKAQSAKSPNGSNFSVNNSSLQNRSDCKLLQSNINNYEFSSINPIQIKCDNCNTFYSSIVFTECTNYTYIIALILTIFCLCWIPFILKKYFMKISHCCPNCERLIGEYDFIYTKLNKVQ